MYEIKILSTGDNKAALIYKTTLRLRENLIAAEESRLSGKSGYSIDEVSSMMKAAVKEVLDGKRRSKIYGDYLR